MAEPGNETPDHRGKIVIFGLFSGKNLGNEATLAALLQQLDCQFPGVQLVCVTPPGSPIVADRNIPRLDVDPARLPGYFWRIRWQPLRRCAEVIAYVLSEPLRIWRARRALQDADLMIVAGTGVIEDFGQGPLDLPTSVLRWTCAARLADAVPVFLCVGAGPIQHPLSRVLLCIATRLAGRRSYRDDYSRRYMQSIGFDASWDRVVPDLALGLTHPVGVSAAQPPVTVGVGLMTYYGWNVSPTQAEELYQTYLSKISTFCDWLLKQNYRVRLLIGDTESDRRIKDDVLNASGTEGRIEYDDVGSVDELLAQIDSVDLVVATRYHNVLLSLLLHKPTIAINYSPKGEALMESVGALDYCQDIEQLDVERLLDQFNARVSEADSDGHIAQFVAQARCDIKREVAACKAIIG